MLTINITKRISILAALFAVLFVTHGESQSLPKALIITGNGNVPNYKTGYPPWIHEFQNERVIKILEKTTQVDVTTDLTLLEPRNLEQYDLIISNSLFLTPDEKQLAAIYEFVSKGKSYLTLHCGILSLLNWDKYEEFIGGIFIGGPSSVPHEFKVTTANIEFWGYQYSFRKPEEHPVSIVTDDFIIRDELYHFQPSIRDFHVIARAENLPVMWWHPVGKGRVMTLTLGHNETGKDNPGYQDLLVSGVKWLTGMPLIYGKQPKVVSTRDTSIENFMELSATTHGNESITFNIPGGSANDIFKAESTPTGKTKLKLTGKPGVGKFTVEATTKSGLTSTKSFDVQVVPDGKGNIAAYHGNTATSSSKENESAVFDPANIIDDDSTTRWSSAPTETAWIALDLKKVYSISKIEILWESSFAKNYEVLGSLVWTHMEYDNHS